MTRPWIRCAALAVLVGASSVACGAEKKPAAEPEPEPSVSASVTPSATPSSPPTQPRGVAGVTYEILNWEKYAADPAVLAWKQTTEAAGASMNTRKVLPALRQGSTPSMFKLYLGNVQDGWANEWHVRPVAKILVQSATTGAKKSTLQVCLWDPSSVFYQKDGSAYDGVKEEWTRQIVGMTVQGTRWRVSSLETPGKCKGVPPL